MRLWNIGGIATRYAISVVCSVVPATVMAQAGPSAAAAGTGETENGDDIVVTGNWLGDAKKHDVFDHPGARDVVRRESFALTGGVSLRDALERVAGVNAPAPNGTGNHEMALNFGVRGLNPRLASRSTVLLDGIPVPFAPYGQPQLSFAGVSLGNLDAVDVVRGGGSVRYGPQNVGGIVNFVTRAIPDAPLSASLSVQGGVAARGEDGLRSTVNLMLGGKTEGGFGAALLYTTVRAGGYRDRADSRINDVILKLLWEIDAKNEVSAIGQYYDGRADMPGGLSRAAYAADPFQSTRPFDSFWGHREMGGVTYRFSPGERTQWTTTAFRTHTLRDGYLDQGTNLTQSPREYDVTGIETRLSQAFATGPLRHEIGAGYRFIDETSGERRYFARKALGLLPTRNSPFDRDTNGRTRAHALFVDDRIDIGDLRLIPGLRYEFIDQYQLNRLNGIEFAGTYSVPLPSLAVEYRPSRIARLFANSMGSFGSVQYSRMSVAEATSYGPERARTWEAGGRYDDGTLSFEATAFLINFNNQYESNQQTNSVTARGRTRHRGVEMAAGVRPVAPLKLYANYTLLDARIREDGANFGNRIPFSSSHSGVFGANLSDRGWSLNLDGQWQTGQFADNANTLAENAAGNTGRIPGFVVFGARAARDMGPAWSKMSLGVGVRNIFDRRYFTRSFDDNNLGKFVEEPRTIYLQMSFKH